MRVCVLISTIPQYYHSGVYVVVAFLLSMIQPLHRLAHVRVRRCPGGAGGDKGAGEAAFVVKLTGAVFIRRMSRAGLCPRSTVCVTHSFVMRWPRCLPLPKCCPGAGPNSLLIHAALGLEGENTGTKWPPLSQHCSPTER